MNYSKRRVPQLYGVGCVGDWGWCFDEGDYEHQYKHYLVRVYLWHWVFSFDWAGKKSCRESTYSSNKEDA